MLTYFVYLMTNQYNTVLYTGVTGDLAKSLNPDWADLARELSLCE